MSKSMIASVRGKFGFGQLSKQAEVKPRRAMNKTGIESFTGLKTDHYDFRVADSIPPTVLVDRVLESPLNWLSDTYQIGESDCPIDDRIGFVGRLHDFVDAFDKYHHRRAKFFCFGKRYGGIGDGVETTVIRDLQNVGPVQVNKQSRAFRTAFDKMGALLTDEIRVFFAYYNLSRNARGSHWTMSAYVLRGAVNTESARMHSYYFDSFGKSPPEEVRRIHNEIASIISMAVTVNKNLHGTDSRNVTNMQSYQKNPEIDCGVWVCWCMLQSVLYAALDPQTDDALEMPIDAFMKSRYALLKKVLSDQVRRHRREWLQQEEVVDDEMESYAFRQLFFRRRERLRIVVLLFGSEAKSSLIKDLSRLFGDEHSVRSIPPVASLVDAVRAEHPDLHPISPTFLEIEHPDPELCASSSVRKSLERQLRQEISPPNEVVRHGSYNWSAHRIVLLVENRVAAVIDV